MNYIRIVVKHRSETRPVIVNNYYKKHNYPSLCCRSGYLLCIFVCRPKYSPVPHVINENKPLTLCSCVGIGGTEDQGSGSASSNSSSNSDLGDYNVIIESCRLATDYEGEPIIIVKYKFTNNGDEPACFAWSLKYDAFQDGVGLNQCYFVDDSANYSSDNQTKEIKKGASLFVEVAYKLNDSTTDVEIDVSELISFSDKKIIKTFYFN